MRLCRAQAPRQASRCSAVANVKQAAQAASTMAPAPKPAPPQHQLQRHSNGASDQAAQVRGRRAVSAPSNHSQHVDLVARAVHFRGPVRGQAPLPVYLQRRRQAVTRSTRLRGCVGRQCMALPARAAARKAAQFHAPQAPRPFQTSPTPAGKRRRCRGPAPARSPSQGPPHRPSRAPTMSFTR